MRNLEEFTRRNAGNPELQEVLDAFQSIPAISNDEEFTVAVRGLLPAYFADYWGRVEEFAPMRASVEGSHISGLDENLAPDLIDDREPLGSLTLPALVIVGRYDVICGVRWSHELNKLIPGSELLILENSGHFGHLEEPENFARAIVGFATAMPRHDRPAGRGLKPPEPDGDQDPVRLRRWARPRIPNPGRHLIGSGPATEPGRVGQGPPGARHRLVGQTGHNLWRQIGEVT